jgi:hypothetical protein
MLHRVIMEVIQVSVEVFHIPNSMLPIATLTDGGLSSLPTRWIAGFSWAYLRIDPEYRSRRSGAIVSLPRW